MARDGGRAVPRYAVVAEFRGSRVNEFVSPAEFTLDAMGVPDGCEILDERPERRAAPDRRSRHTANPKTTAGAG